MSKKQTRMTRKDFLKKSCAGFTGLMAHKVLNKSPLRFLGKNDTPLEMRGLGRSGIRATALGFGAARTMEPSLLKTALDSGINFIDTGRTYFNGNNERMVGDALGGIRKDVIIQSKMFVRPREGDSPAGAFDALRKEMESNLQASLKALQTDYIDIMLIHEASDIRILKNETVMEFFSSAKEKGRIRAHGFSCHDEIELLQFANESGFYDIIMLPFNHKGSYVHMLSGKSREWDQPRIEIELEKAHKNNLGVVVMKTCSAGPYAPAGADRPSFRGAIQWVLDHAYVGVAAVAMSNLDEIKEDVQAG
jgi:aryl-alcohol dehydrogenase-like predicted oxidoreductase